MRRFIVSGLFVLLSCTAFSQVVTETVKTNENTYDDVKLLYRNEATFGFLVHTNGLGLNYRRGWHVTAASRRVLEIEGVSFRHPKETKVVNQYVDNPKGYFYGKLNSVFILRAAFGYQNTIFSKPEKNGVEVRYVTMLGFSLGLAKPVYLDIIESNPSPHGDPLIVTERYDPTKHFQDNIYGRGPFLRGIGETTIYPGMYAKFGLNFEHGPLDDDIRFIETGIILDGYLKGIPMMANDHPNQFLLSLYLNFSFGSRWY
ncbi:MAG TPA: hypothetical protein VL651_01630 [Bacteroidia bacterium]|nr:hypothetical protein [Bacteroidia bacterium]